MPCDGLGYGLVQAAEKGIGGGIGPAQDGGSGQVTFYVEVDDPAAYLKNAEARRQNPRSAHPDSRIRPYLRLLRRPRGTHGRPIKGCRSVGRDSVEAISQLEWRRSNRNSTVIRLSIETPIGRFMWWGQPSGPDGQFEA